MPRRAAGAWTIGNHSAVACGPGRSAPKACEAGDQRGAASVCADRLAGVVVRRVGCGSRSGGVLKGRRHGRRQDRRWASAWSPEQIAHRLRLDFPHDETMRISHEAIYQSLYVQGRGALRPS